MKVKDCKLTKPESCQKTDSIIDVSKKLRDLGVRHLVVLDGKKPVGMIASVDIVNRAIAEEKDVKKMKVEDIMTSPLQVVDCQEEVHKAFIAMIKKDTFSCPIVTEKDEYVGMLTFAEALKNLEEK